MVRYLLPTWLFLFSTLLWGCQSGQTVRPAGENPPATQTPVSTPTPVPTLAPTPTPTPTPTIDRQLAMNKFVEAALLEQAGKFDDASNAYLDALEGHQQSAYIRATAARSLLNGGMIDEAVKSANQAIEIDPDLVEAYDVLAQASLARQDNDGAIRQYEKMLEIRPDLPEAQVNLSNLYMRVQRYEDAVSLLQAILKEEPPQPIIYRLQLAFLLFQLQRYDEALVQYRTLAEEMPESCEIHLQVARTYEVLEKFDDAIVAYLNALGHCSTPKQELSVRKALGELYQQRGSYTEAVYQFQTVKELDPQDIPARKTLVYLYLEQNRGEDALNEIQELTNQFPADYSLQQLQFESLLELNREEEAYRFYLSAFRNALQTDQQNSINAFLWDLLREESLAKLEELSLLATLRDSLDAAAEKENPALRTRFALAKLAVYESNPSLVTHLNRITALLEESVDRNAPSQMEEICAELLRWYKVRLAFTQGKAGLALQAALQRCALAYADRPTPHQLTGTLALDQENWYAAEASFNRALSLVTEDSPMHHEIQFQLAWAYDKLNRIDDVERVMQALLETNPNDAEVLNYLGYFYADRNIHLDDALQMIEKALKIHPNDANFLDSLGWVYYRLGETNKALETLLQALELDQDHPVIYEHAGDIYLHKGQKAEALEYWRLAYELGPEHPYEFTTDVQQRLKTKMDEVKVQLAR